MVLIAELVDMLSLRSSAWRFDYALWRWVDGAVDVLASGKTLAPPAPDWLAQIEVPQLVGRTPRAKSLTLEQIRNEAFQIGVGDLYDAFVAGARQRKMQIAAGRRSVRAGYPPSEGGTVCACYLDTSSPDRGLNVGMDANRLGGFSGLPGSPAPTKGFLNLNRYLQTQEDVRRLFAFL